MIKKDNQFGFIKGNEIYLKGFLDLSDRKIGEVKESEEESIQYFVNRYETAKAKVEQLAIDIKEAENKGSYLMKLIHLRDKLKKHDGLGDYLPLFEQLEQLESDLENLISSNKARNEEMKIALLKEFEGFTHVSDWRTATDDILNIKDRWLKTGAVAKEKNEEFERLFSQNMQEFFDRKREYVDEKKKVTEIRLRKMQDLIGRARRLNPQQPGSNLKDEVEILRKEWSAIGQVPIRDKKYLEKDFNYKISNLFKNRGGARPMTVKPEELQQNLQRKKELILKGVELEKSDSFLELQALQEEWQKIGLIPKEEYKELTEQFKTLCEKAFEKRFLEQLAQNKDDSYKSKNNREKTRFKIILLKDLLKRDEHDLQAFMSNMDQFNRDQKFDKVMNNKLLNQKRKVTVKRQLLNDLKNSLNDISIQR